MELRTTDIDGDVMTVTIDGGIDNRTAGEFAAQVERLVEAGVTKIVIDASGLTMLSSAGIGTLLRLHKRMRERGGDVKLGGVPGLVADILRMTRLDLLFELYPDADRARLAFREPGP